jgi:hypothetical protein
VCDFLKLAVFYLSAEPRFSQWRRKVARFYAFINPLVEDIALVACSVTVSIAVHGIVDGVVSQTARRAI